MLSFFLNFSSKLDVWMVFCVIFVFSTLLEFAILIFVQKQIFDRKVKKAVDALCREKLLSRSTSRYSGNRESTKSSNRMSLKETNGRNNMKDANVEDVRSPASSVNNLKLVDIPWEDTIENGIVGKEVTEIETETALSNEASEQKHVASQTSRKFLST